MNGLFNMEEVGMGKPNDHLEEGRILEEEHRILEVEHHILEVAWEVLPS